MKHTATLFLALSAVGLLPVANADAVTLGDGVFGEAQWIGGGDGDMTLHAQYLTTFRLSWTVGNDGSTERTAWLKFGGGDERFCNSCRNPWHIVQDADSVFVLVEADCSKGEIRFSRCGMSWAGREVHAFPAPRLREAGTHRVELAVAYGTTDVVIDAGKVGVVNLNPARGRMDRSLNLTGDFAAYPCLGNVSCGTGVSDVELRHYRSPSNVIARGRSMQGEAGGAVASLFQDRSPLQLRTSFSCTKPVEKAVLLITARGIYDACINGTLVNKDWFFCPGFTQYDRTQLYQAYDVTQLIRSDAEGGTGNGSNTIEVALSEGWWSGASTYSAQNWNFYGDRQSLLARLALHYADGTGQDIVTDPDTWECCSDGSRLYASMFNGEVVDGSRPLFDANSLWHKAVSVPTEGTTVKGEDYSRVELVEQKDMPVHPVDTLTAVSCTEVRPKVLVYDMGQNMAGVPLVTLSRAVLDSSRAVRLRYAEVLYPQLEQFGDMQGEMLTENYRAALSQDIFIAPSACEGKCQDSVFSPRHTLHGFRYIELTGIEKPLPLEDVRAVALSSLDGITAHYECSDTLVNRLWQNILWSARSNFISIPTDCPQRNERMGWSGDISVFAHTATYLSDVEDFLRRHLRTMRDTQSPAGQFTDVAPMRGEGFGGLLWGSAGITVAWECYRQWKDIGLLREHYDAMVRYMDFVAREYIDQTTGLLVQHREWGDLGDWLSPVYDSDDKSLLWECYYIHDLDIMAKTAALLGREADAAAYGRLRDERKAFFRDTYLDRNDCRTVWSSFDERRKGQPVDTQVSYILPLAFGICDGAERDALAGHLARLIESDGYHLMVGFIGVPWIGETLSRIGRNDLIYRILACTEYPSWLYPVCQGATTIWERLNAYVAGEGFPAGNGMNSFNHYSFGSIGSWMMERSLGISVSLPEPHSKERQGTVFISPVPDPTGHITWARGHFDSRLGRIESSWERQPDGKVRYSFTIPAGAVAIVTLPGQKPRKYKAGTYCKVLQGD